MLLALTRNFPATQAANKQCEGEWQRQREKNYCLLQNFFNQKTAAKQRNSKTQKLAYATQMRARSVIKESEMIRI